MPLPEELASGDVGHLAHHDDLHALYNRLQPGMDAGADGDLLALDATGDVTTVDSGAFQPATVNTDSDPGGTFYVGSVDPDTLPGVTLAAGDVWIEVPA